MKKLLIVGLLLLVVAVMLVACENDSTNTDNTTAAGTTAPETTTTETTAPETTAPETTAPETTVPETTAPETTAPETTDPETTVPETTESETTVPDTTEPDTTEPETTVPDTTEPETTEPGTTEPQPVKVVAGISFDAMGNVYNGNIDMNNLYFASSTEYQNWGKVAEIDHLVDSLKVAGWVAFFTETEGVLGYSIDGAEAVYPEGFSTPAEAEVLEYVAANVEGGIGAARMFSDIPVRDLAAGEHTIALCAKDENGNQEVFAEFKLVKVDNSLTVDFNEVTVSGSYQDPWAGNTLIPSLTAEDLIYVMHYGSMDLGKIDLSKYSKLIVTYATPVGADGAGSTHEAQYDATAQRVLLLNAESPIKEAGTAFEDAPAAEAIIASAHYNMSASNMELTTVEIDLSEIDYNGQTYLTFDFRNAEGAFGAISYLIVVTGVVFA